MYFPQSSAFILLIYFIYLFIILKDQPKTCVCNAGWSGNSCNDRICTGNCVNGNCLLFNGKTTCICNNGFKGRDCKDPYCPNGLCKNGGTCTIQNGQHKCSCAPGYEGIYCQQGKVCLHGGTLTNNKCTCAVGWAGDNCERLMCYGGYCKNGGTCSIKDNSRMCLCSSGFHGYLCEFTNTT